MAEIRSWRAGLLSFCAVLGSGIPHARGQSSIAQASQAAPQSVAPPAQEATRALPAALDTPLAETLPAMLTRVAPSIVKVRRGSRWGTGFVFGSRRTIVTSYELVNGPGALQIVAADGVNRVARVVAWSEAEDLALLELPVNSESSELPAARGSLTVGSEAIMIYQPRNPELADDVSGGWTAPLPRFTRITRVSKNELDIDLSVWGLLGDDGAPVISPGGEVIGIVSGHSWKQRRAIVTPVERIEHLLLQRERQGVFSATAPRRWFNSWFVSPMQETVFDEGRESIKFFGAGVESGYRYDWLFAGLSVGLFQSDAHHLSSTVVETIGRGQLELQLGPELRLFKNSDVFFGPGAALRFDDSQSTSLDPRGALRSDDEGRVRVRPELVFGLTLGNFFARDVFTIASVPEVRLDFGFSLGPRSFD